MWLNAASSITYPTAFTGKERKVSITGEVYFEVARNPKQPFKVHVTPSPLAGAKGVEPEIEVLGTSFNINAYVEEQVIKTSLLEGSVKIGAQILKPGQAYVNGKIIQTDVDQDMAWKMVILVLMELILPTAMRQLSRWYDIDVKYSGKIKERKFKGALSRNLHLLEVLEILKDMNVKFTLQGKTLFVQ